MRVILVTVTDKLNAIFNTLNPQLEYRAIIVDEPEKANEVVSRVGLSTNLIYPLYDLKECLENFYCDILICVSDDASADIENKLRIYNFPTNKTILLRDIDNSLTFMIKRNLQYYKLHAEEFEIFATGISYTGDGILPQQFRRKLFNFGSAAEDLYYNYQIAKFVIQLGGSVKYALIGLAPYSLHYDLSKASNNNFLLLKYCMIFNDLHNFWMSANEYRKLFREEYLSISLPIENININGYLMPHGVVKFDSKGRLNVRGKADEWKNKNYPETCEENIQILDDYLKLCEENNVRALIFLPPMSTGYMKHFSKIKLDELYFWVRNSLKKHPTAKFVDGWRLKGFSDEDFRDYGHLNIKGAAKFSSMLNQLIEQLDAQ